MKKKSKVLLILLVVSVGLLIGCQNDESQVEELNQIDLKATQESKEVETINLLLENARINLEERSPNLSEFEFISFEVVKNLTTNEIYLDNFKVEEFFPIGSREDYQGMRGNYSISCDLGGPPNDWTENCGSKWACGQLVLDCLEQGGCATVCERTSTTENPLASVLVTYLPKVKN